MWKGHTGINNILDIMHECIEEPRKDKSNLPLTDSLTIPVTKRGKFIGPGGNNLKKILTETGVQVWHYLIVLFEFIYLLMHSQIINF